VPTREDDHRDGSTRVKIMVEPPLRQPVEANVSQSSAVTGRLDVTERLEAVKLLHKSRSVTESCHTNRDSPRSNDRLRSHASNR
jgi:hypothetical protein